MKLVRENISFKRGEDPKKVLHLGKENLIRKWLDGMGVIGYTINEDFTIDVNGFVDLFSKNLAEFPLYIQFGVVNRFFSCKNNQLTSLGGVPKEVKGYFSCSFNRLTSLEGAPKIVEGNFYCSNNAKEFTEEEVRKYTEVGRKIYV